MVFLGGRPLASKGKRVGQDRPLGNGIYLIVATFQRRHNQCPAGNTFCIPQRRNQNIKAVTLFGKRRQRCGNHNSSNVFQLDVVDRRCYPHPLKHIYNRLGLDLGLVAVPGPVQSDHQAISHKLVVSHPFERGEILDADRVCTRCHQNDEHKKHGGYRDFHIIPLLT